MYQNSLKYFNGKNYNVSTYVNGVCIKHQNNTVYILPIKEFGVLKYLVKVFKNGNEINTFIHSNYETLFTTVKNKITTL